ncbi:MAG: lipoate--protein ligase family protein [Asgard group archaeon]|nr:lipoate--protein ligase family protein [Asgard group archaeon]
MKTANLRTKKGVIEVEIILEDGRISKAKITGDFFVYPEEALESLENALVGSTGDEDDINKKISAIYKEKKVSTPGITIDDWLIVIKKALTS